MPLVAATVSICTPAAAQPADGGAPDAAVDGLPVDASPTTDLGPDHWVNARIAELTERKALLRQQVEQLDTLSGQAVEAPAALAPLLGSLADPELVQRRLQQLPAARARLQAELDEARQRAEVIEPPLRRAAAALDRATKRGRQLPAARRRKARRASQRLTLLRLEQQLLSAEIALIEAQRRYLLRSQPARQAAWQTTQTAERELAKQRAEADQAEKQASAAMRAARQAQQAALKAQREARSEAERLIAGQRVKLLGVSRKQAALEQRLARDRAALVGLRDRLERFRGRLVAKIDALKKGWPENAARHDPLYDRVVEELKRVRPLAVADLTQAIRGLPDAPAPPERLGARVRELSLEHQEAIGELERQREDLARRAEQLEGEQRALVDQRLALLQREVTWLNEHRTALMRRISRAKYNRLTGLSRETVAQLTREIAHLGFDGLYWVLRRLRQIDEVPRLILDIFTVGGMLWRLIKLILLILLLRYTLRRWDGWLQLAVERTGRSLTLGRYALLLAKLADTLRHSGRALLVLIVAAVVYRLLGGHEAATEIQVVYIIFFWIAVYRFQLRLVESVAKYTGMERALRAAEGEELLEEDPNLEGPPVPRAVRLALQIAAGREERIVPASVLLVRSVRAATRYILAVVLVLELTSLAVGKGTIYGLTINFSWLAALPFVYYFLKLWRPHIVNAFERLTRDRPPTALGRLVHQSEQRWYGVLIVAAAFGVVFGNRLARFARRYLTSLDATKKLLAFIFRRQVARHAQQLGRVVAKRQNLPQVLLDQFPMGPLEPRDNPRRPPVMDEIVEVFQGWREDHAEGSAALIGAAGMGKTTVVRLLERELKTPVLRGEPRTKLVRPARVIGWLAEVFGFSPKPSSEKELIRLIREDRRPLVALDNCHNLFLRQVGGFEGWETFVRVVNETCDNVFWLITFNEAAWDYLYNLSGRVHYFRRVIEMPAWSERDLRRLMMTRMGRCRYRASFSDLIVTQLHDVSLSAQIGRTSEGYFRLLWDFTAGNPRLASHFWLDSLVPEPADERAVRVHLFAEPEIAALEKLPDNTVFVLTAITEHENLTPQEAARTTNLPLDFCNFAFRLGLEEGYLYRDGEGGRVRLSRRWQRPIMRFLKRKHLLHS